MSASYPRAIKQFTTKMDYTMDVMAQDVNDLQDEVVALESILGVNPHLMDSTDVAAIGAAPMKSLADRLAALESGRTLPAFTVATNWSGVSPHGPGYVIPLSAPNPSYDPFGCYNGHGFTIQRTGWYSLNAQIGWWANSQVGTRRFVITLNGGWVIIDDKEGYIDADVRYSNLSHIGPLAAGTQVGLLTHHDLASGQRVGYPRLSGVFLRDI